MASRDGRCKRCGEPKAPGMGVRYCSSCKIIAEREANDRERVRARNRARTSEHRPCKDCGEQREPTQGTYCVRCTVKNHRRPCKGCETALVRPKTGAYCGTCKEARRTGVKPQPVPVVSQRDLDIACIDARLKEELAGVELTLADRSVGKEIPPLPAKPLAACIDRAVLRASRTLYNPEVKDAATGGVDRVCDAIGIAGRTLFAWRTGERKVVEFDKADSILQAAGWLWWDVWNERTVRLPVLTVVLRYRFPMKEGWGSKLVRYGEGGTDWRKLAEIDHSFTCEGCEKCEVVEKPRFGSSVKDYAERERVAA